MLARVHVRNSWKGLETSPLYFMIETVRLFRGNRGLYGDGA